MSADRLLALSLGVGAMLPAVLSNDLTTPVIGVPLTTVAGAILGTYAAVAYDEEAAQKPRGRLFGLTIATVILASLCAGVVPRYMGWEWASGGIEAGVGGLFAVVLYYGLPPSIIRGRELIRNFKFADLAVWRKDRMPEPPELPRQARRPGSPTDNVPGGNIPHETEADK